MTNKTYDILKYIAQIVLPALGALYAALAGLWGFPYGEEIVGTIAAIDVFLGALLQISSNNYYKSGKDTIGSLIVDEENGLAKLSFDASDIPAEELMAKKTISLKVDSGVVGEEE